MDEEFVTIQLLGENYVMSCSRPSRGFFLGGCEVQTTIIIFGYNYYNYLVMEISVDFWPIVFTQLRLIVGSKNYSKVPITNT